MLRRGARVVLAGPPNAGKSSLLNAMVGEERAIVTAVEGTTRDTVEVPLVLDGIPIVLVDTAGLRPSEDEVERIGIARAQDELARADLVLWLGEPEQAPEHPNMLRIHARCDCDGREAAPAGGLAVSSLTGENISTLLRLIHAKVAYLYPKEDGLALTERQATLIAEARHALGRPVGDLVIQAEQLRQARGALDRIVGVNGTEEMLDALFGRFCLGK
jgi:tRNA modification GTPase